MSSTPSLTSKDLIKILERKGFVLDRTKGSHQIFINFEQKLRVVVPMHNKDLAAGTLHAILKQAGINKEEI